MAKTSDKTKQNETHISIAQERAMGALLAGSSMKSAAVEADVSRSTLHRWVRDSAFVVEYVRARIEVREHLVRRVVALSGAALDVVENALDEGDTRVAVAVLRGAGLLSGLAPEVSSFEAEVIQRQRIETEHRMGLQAVVASARSRGNPSP